MAKPPKPARGYVSPVVLAGRILARARAGEHVSKQALRTAERIEALSAWVKRTLERNEAPYRVARWVAWGEQPSDVQDRADLGALVRSARPSKGWPDVGHLKLAFDLYLQDRAAGLVGGLSAGPSKVPVERYLAAIDALPKRQRRRASEESDASLAIVAEDDVLRALVEARPSRRPRRPPVIKLRTTPLRTDATPTASPAALVGIERVVAENTRLREQHQEAELKAALREVEAERQKELHSREIAKLNAKIETLERARSGGPPAWVVLGSAVGGAVATEIVRRGVDLLHAGDTKTGAQANDAAPSLGADGEALFMRLLPVLDNVTRAQRHAEDGAPSAAVAEGLRMALEQLDAALARSGVDRVPAVGRKFSPIWHEAVEHVDAPEPAGVVLREVLPGYMTGGRLLRAPSVVVSKGQVTDGP